MRIVSLVPSLTELLFDLGLSEEVVGITKFCVHPAAWHTSKRRVGGTKNVRVSDVLALRPDIVLASKEENVREQVEALPGVYLTDITDLPGAVAEIRAIGRLVGRAERAEALAAEITAAFERLREARAHLADSAAAPVPAAYFIWRDPWMVVGGDTFINDMMERAGLVNVYRHLRRYPTVDPAEVRGLALLSSEPYPFGEKHAAELPGATAQLVDGEMFSWYGSRLRLAPAYFQKLYLSLCT
jgi:ABC-type Fe3+-hydroxamate transport system substrate-binding protein